MPTLSLSSHNATGADAQKQQLPKLPDPSYPCLWFVDKDEGVPFGKMVSKGRCPNDKFDMAFVDMNPSNTDDPYKNNIVTASANGISDGNTNLGGSGYLAFSKSLHVPDRPLHIAVIRQSDGKQVVPKALTPDGKLVDISGTKKRVCLLFKKGTNEFAGFRMGISLDGTRVTGNDFARAPTLADKSPRGLPGVPCSQYFERPAEGPAVEGRMVDVYSPGAAGTCQIVVDDCTK